MIILTYILHIEYLFFSALNYSLSFGFGFTTKLFFICFSLTLQMHEL